MVEIVGKTNFDFMGKRKYTFMTSGLMVFIGCIALFQIGWGTANLGIDFAGGTAVQLRFDNPMPIEEARAALEQGGLGEADLQEIVRENKLMIRVKESNTIEEEVADRIVKVFEDVRAWFDLMCMKNPSVRQQSSCPFRLVMLIPYWN